MQNTGLDETQAGIKIARRNINNLRYADETTIMAESKEKLKSLLMKVKEESEKVGLKLSTEFQICIFLAYILLAFISSLNKHFLRTYMGWALSTEW